MQDLFVTNGQTGLPSAYTNIMFKNLGDGQFQYSAKSGLESSLDTGAYTYFDFDNDGDLDIAAIPQLGPILFYRNGSSSPAIEFELADEVGNRFGIGSIIIIHYGPDNSLHQMREIQASGWLYLIRCTMAHFGLGEHAKVDRIEIKWSTGQTSVIGGPFDSGRRYQIRRSST